MPSFVRLLGKGGFQRGQRLGRLAGLGVARGRRLNCRNGGVGRRRVGLLEERPARPAAGRPPGSTRPSGRRSAAASPSSTFANLVVDGELVGMVERRQHAGEALGRLACTSRRGGRGGPFPSAGGCRRRFPCRSPRAAMAFRRASTARANRPCSDRIMPRRRSKQRIGVVELGRPSRRSGRPRRSGFSRTASGTIARTIVAGLRIAAQGALVAAQGVGVFPALLVVPAGGEQRDGLEAIALGLGARRSGQRFRERRRGPWRRCRPQAM